MDGDSDIRMSQPRIHRRLNLESVNKLSHPGIRTSGADGASMSPMTNLAHNLSGASLDATPKRRLISQDNVDMEDSIATVGTSKGSMTGAELFGEKENSYVSTTASSPIKSSSEEFLVRRSPGRTRSALARIDVNSPIKTSFVKPAQPVSSGVIPSSRLPSIEDVDSQDSGCFPGDSQYFKYPEPLYHRRMSDRNTSPASSRSCTSSLSGGGSLKYDGPAKLDFSFMSSGEDEGIPDELYEEEDAALPTSASLSQLIATPLSEKATRQFSSHHDDAIPFSDSPSVPTHADILRVQNDGHCPKQSHRAAFRRSQSLFEHNTPNARSHVMSSPINMSSVARGLFVHDEDTGSSPLAPLGLHAVRLRMKPSRVIQTVGGPSFKRGVESPSTADSSAIQQQENKRRKDDNDERPMFQHCLDHQVGNNTKTSTNSSLTLSRVPRIQRCHSETEATIMRALQRSSEEPDLIGDCTGPYVLPLIPGKHQDLKSITPQTLVDLMAGKFQNFVESYTIVDCRYPYEFESGHITDAVNLWTKDMVWNVFMEGRKKLSPSPGSEQGEKKRNILIFHCEFSSERGPALSRYLRNKDRDDNKDNYPALHWPEVYLLHGGYKSFYEQFDDCCHPRGYLPMNQQGLEEELRRCRAKTKACNGEGKSGRPLTKSTSRRLALL